MLRTLCRTGRCAVLVTLSAIAALGPLGTAHAAPPSITGAPATLEIPRIGFITVNLRELGVIAGSAPLIVQSSSLQLLVNGQPAGGLNVSLLANNGPGRTCITISNTDFSLPGEATYALRLAVSNLPGTATTPVQTIAVTNTPGPIVDTTPEQAACNDPNRTPVANAGGDRAVSDTDGQPGESVTLSGAGSSDPDIGTVLTYQWFVGESSLGPPSTNPTLTTRLPDGVHEVALIVTDDSGDPQTAINTDLVQIIVNALSLPTANAGPDQLVADTDRSPGELVALTGSATDPDGSIASFQWLLGDTSLGTGASLQARLPDGVNVVTLVVTDNAGNVGRDTVQVSVGVPVVRGSLSELPNLNPNQRRTALALDRVCTQLDELENAETSPLTADQLDLRRRCDGIYFSTRETVVADQVGALNALVADDFALARTQTLLFANTQYMSVMDRLMALRGGARGLSLAGLSIMVDGKMAPLAQLHELFGDNLGGGASSDPDEMGGGLLSDKWGVWARGNYSFGDKDANSLSPGFDADQWALIGGVDYRISDKAVIGAAVAYGDSTIEFDPGSEGALGTTSWAASVYGSAYAAKNFYLDAIVNVANASYDARRNITYVDGMGLVNVDARGDTDGMTLSGGASSGYDFLIGKLTVSPNIGVFYIDASIDSFIEEGAGGLNLIYDEQEFESLTANLGLRLAYVWNASWGVFLPHLRADYVREFEDDVDVFGVRFAADPNAPSTPPILVETDNPDRSYWRLAAGFSAQFKFGVSGYIEYQRLESFESISFQDVSIGLRMQRSF
jgi:uncharacterized protein YhjY with autotransporter beta-barrel domain